jgi:hypothetical protein
MFSEQRIRSVLFYLSVFIFFVGLPFILSFALGYKLNPRAFKFTKTGIIFIKTQPQGASVYLDKKLLNEKTSLTIRELLPGKYNISLELEKHYPWRGQINVDAGKVTRLEKIILFPLRQNIRQLNKEKISWFWTDEKRSRVYYINKEERIIYSSDPEGDNFEKIGDLPAMEPLPKKFKISPDKEKLLCFNYGQIGIILLRQRVGFVPRESPFVISYPETRINDVFWHSDSYHIIVITTQNIEVLEAKLESKPINLVNLNKRNALGFYDENNDTLYFIDSQKAEDANFYDNVYKLELGAKFFPFQVQEFIKMKSKENE